MSKSLFTLTDKVPYAPNSVAQENLEEQRDHTLREVVADLKRRLVVAERTHDGVDVFVTLAGLADEYKEIVHELGTESEEQKA